MIIDNEEKKSIKLIDVKRPGARLRPVPAFFVVKPSKRSLKR